MSLVLEISNKARLVRVVSITDVVPQQFNYDNGRSVTVVSWLSSGDLL